MKTIYHRHNGMFIAEQWDNHKLICRAIGLTKSLAASNLSQNANKRTIGSRKHFYPHKDDSIDARISNKTNRKVTVAQQHHATEQAYITAAQKGLDKQNNRRRSRRGRIL